MHYQNNLIKKLILPDQVRTQANFAALLLRQVTVEALVDCPEEADHNKRQQDEIARKDRVWDEGVEGFVREVAGVIERVAHLAAGGKTGEEHQRCRMEEEDRFVRVGGPSKAQHGGPDDPAEAAHAGNAVGIGGFDIALGN